MLSFTGSGDLDAMYQNAKLRMQGDVKILKQKEKEKNKSDIDNIKKQKKELANLVADSEFTKVFKSYYGEAYNEKSITKLIKVGLDSNLSPTISYEAKSFNVKNDFLNNRKSFNQNSNIKEILGNQQDFTSLNNMNNIRINNIENPGDLKQSVLADIFDDDRELYAFERKTRILEPGQVYKEAETIFMQEYNKQYKKVLEPKIKAKYGFSI